MSKITKEEFFNRLCKFLNKKGVQFCPKDIGLECEDDCIIKDITCQQCRKQAIEQGVEK